MMKRTMKCVMTFSLALAASSCDDTTTFSTVTLSGPTCADGNALVRPIVVELRSSEGEYQQVFTGRERPGGASTTLSLPDGAHDYDARFGRCANEMTAEGGTYTCGEITWYDDSAMNIDPAAPGGTVVIPAPSDVSCTN